MVAPTAPTHRAFPVAEFLKSLSAIHDYNQAWNLESKELVRISFPILYNGSYKSPYVTPPPIVIVLLSASIWILLKFARSMLIAFCTLTRFCATPWPPPVARNEMLYRDAIFTYKIVNSETLIANILQGVIPWRLHLVPLQA